jgi:hypothetical protein
MTKLEHFAHAPLLRCRTRLYRFDILSFTMPSILHIVHIGIYCASSYLCSGLLQSGIGIKMITNVPGQIIFSCNAVVPIENLHRSPPMGIGQSPVLQRPQA